MIEHSGFQPSGIELRVTTVEGIWVFMSFSKYLLILDGFFFALCCELEQERVKGYFTWCLVGEQQQEEQIMVWEKVGGSQVITCHNHQMSSLQDSRVSFDTENAN